MGFYRWHTSGTKQTKTQKSPTPTLKCHAGQGPSTGHGGDPARATGARKNGPLAARLACIHALQRPSHVRHVREQDCQLWPTEDATSNRRQPLWPKRKHPCVRPVGGGSHSSHLIVLLQAGTGVTRRRRTFTSTTWKEWKVQRDWRSGNAVKLSFPSLPCDLRHTHLILGVRYRAKARRRRSY